MWAVISINRKRDYRKKEGDGYITSQVIIHELPNRLDVENPLPVYMDSATNTVEKDEKRS